MYLCMSSKYILIFLALLGVPLLSSANDYNSHSRNELPGPTFTVPPNVTIQCDEDYSNLTLTGDVIDEDSDCPTGVGEATYINDLRNGSCDGENILLRIWQLTDNCSASNSKLQIITIREFQMIVIIQLPIYRL